MFALLSSGTELRRFSKGIMPRIAILVLLFIPLLYGALYLWAFWNPTNDMDHLPVAIVNEDTGATGTDGSVVNAGTDVVNQLVADQQLKWTEVNAQQAATGVQEGTYYFSVTIPADFSSSVVSPAGDNPQSAKIDVSYNDANSFLATTLGKTAMLTLRNAVAENVGETQVNTILVGLNSASDGFQQAADGASKLADGATTAQSGSSQITVGLESLADGLTSLDHGTGTLADGLGELASGARTLSSGLSSAATGATTLQSGASQLSSGAQTLATGANALSGGAATLSNGLTSLNAAVNGSNGLANGSSNLSAGAASVSAGAAQVATKVGAATGTPAVPSTISTSTLAEGASALSSGAQHVSVGLTSVSQAVQLCAYASSSGSVQFQDLCATLSQYIGTPSTPGALTTGAAGVAVGAANIDYGVNHVAATSTDTPGLAQALASLSSGSAQVAAGATTVNTGVNGTGGLASSATALAAGGSTVASGASSLASGSSALAAGASTATAGVNTLTGGLTQLSAGASTLSSNLGTAASGSSTLAAGANAAATGASTLTSGSTTLTSGLGSLTGGLGTLNTSLASGATQTSQGSQTAVDAKANVVANPVQLSETWTNQAASWGEGFAPFFIALALFVGGIITWLLLHALPRRALAAGVSGFRAALAGYLPAAVFGLGQVLIMMTVLVFGLGLAPNYLFGTVLFVLLTALTFLALQQMFIITLGTAAGRVLALALLMFQLSSSGGTYPVETTPDFFQAIHPWMPISYVVTGLRQLMTGQLDEQLWISVAVLLGILIGSLAISSFSAARQRIWSMTRLHPEIAI